MARARQIALLIEQLIDNSLHLDRASENFDIARQFSLDAVKHHQFLDANCENTRRLIASLAQRLRVRHEVDKAEALTEYFQAFEQQIPAVEGCDRDQKYSVVALLCALSTAHEPTTSRMLRPAN